MIHGTRFNEKLDEAEPHRRSSTLRLMCDRSNWREVVEPLLHDSIHVLLLIKLHTWQRCRIWIAIELLFTSYVILNFSEYNKNLLIYFLYFCISKKNV